MVLDFIYPVLRSVLLVEHYRLRYGGDVGEIRACIINLRLLHMCLWWFDRCDKDDHDPEKWGNLKPVLHDIESMWEKFKPVNNSLPDSLMKYMARTLEKEETEEEAREFEMDYDEYVGEEKDSDIPWQKVVKAVENWKLGSSQIEGTIEESKLYIRGQCEYLLHCTFKYRSAPSANQMLKFLDAILQHLKALVTRKVAEEAVPLKNQIETFEEKRVLLHAFFKLVPDDCELELRDFKEGLYTIANKVALLAFLFWAKAGDGETAEELNIMLSDMLRMIVKPPVPDGASWYLTALKAMRLQQSHDALLLGQAVPAFLDLLFEYLGVSFHEDLHIIRDGLIILFTFLANPTQEEDAEDEELLLIRDQLCGHICQGALLIPLIDDTRKVLVSDFIPKIERFKCKIRKLHISSPDSSSCYFPRTNGLGFVDFLLQNLKENSNGDKMVIPFANHLIVEIEQELVSLRPHLDDFFELQKDHKELQETLLQLINVAYLTEHAVNSCSLTLYPIWYDMVRLADILDEIKIIKEKLDTVKYTNSCNVVVLPKSVESKDEIPTQAWYSESNEVMVGCEEEINMIVDELICGPKSLEIVSIVGMGGSGKTTLARKVYDAQQVRSSFHIFAFCTVSQVYSTRELLVHILNDIKVVVHEINAKTDDDLAHLLLKQLSGKSYLVVMDDIWKIDAWEKIKSSFPNESIGSRVIFTTREGEVAMKAKGKFSPHSKHLLSIKESWELLQTTAFPQAVFPPNLSDVGQVIARNCGGLPLAIAVIGRVLARKGTSLTLWNEIAEKTTSFASEEGCMKMVELSYNHLPEHLKSCYLYLGVFAEHELIPAKRLMLLWIAEGFIQKPSTDQSVEIVAKQYLTQLVDRSLLEVSKRSSNNEIKICKAHDIIHEFCQRKAQEENIFQLMHKGRACNSSHFNPYRLSIHMGWKSFVSAELRDPGIRSLLYNKKRISSYGCGGTESIFSRFPLVQVLDLEKVELMAGKKEVDRVIESMTLLLHLRYLAVSIYEDLAIAVPSRMTYLKNLETLIIRRSNAFWWSETFWRMERLRHLDVGHCYLIPCPPKFEACPPLYNLECFSTLVLKPGTETMLLKRLPNLRKLSCVNSNLDQDNDSTLALDILNKLELLKLTSDNGLDVILPATLKNLSLHGNILPSLLGKLPHLEVLKIDGYREEIWDIDEEDFPELKFLKLKNSNLREWNAPDGSFPRLEHLVIVECRYLDEIPALLQESTTLKRIELSMPNRRLKKSACQIRDEQKDLGNDIELIISYPKFFGRRI